VNLALTRAARWFPTSPRSTPSETRANRPLWRVRPYVTVLARSNLSWELGTLIPTQQDEHQWYDNLGYYWERHDSYLFAHLDQQLLSFTSRVNYTATTTLSLQCYAEPFLTTGRYFRLRELAEPSASGLRRPVPAVK